MWKRMAHFGFQSIDSAAKPKKVMDVFSTVASSYDIMNDVMSAGTHRCWKSHFVQRMTPLPGMRILDVAGGTGDIAARILKHAQCEVRVIDLNEEMLENGKKRHPHMSFEVGNAEGLVNVADNSQDVFSMTFGIRNCTHIDKVIQEAHRVLKPGGRMMVMEFSKAHPVLQPAYDWYSFNVIPLLGQLIAKDRASYQYLVESIRMFPEQDEFQEMMQEHFEMEPFENLTGGIATIWSGYKVKNDKY